MESEGPADVIVTLITSLICLAPFCLGLVFFFAIGGLIFWVIKSQWKPKDAATLAREREAMQADLDRKVASLRPWQSDSLTDLSTDWNANWTKLGRDLNAHGTIPALSDPKGPALVAFGLRTRGAFKKGGQLLARTSDRSFGYRILPERIDIDVDGTPLGSASPDGSLLSASGSPIGSAIRPHGTPFTIRLGTFAKAVDRRERDYPVVLNGRTIADLANPHIQMLNMIRLGKEEFPPAVELVGIPSDEEETWLLALAILQVAGFNLFESIWTAPSSTGIP